ncbi:4796_t:CDS:1, partial [Paraglomus brasilianum]
MRNRCNNNTAEITISQDEPDSLMQEMRDLVKKRDFDEFAVMQVRVTTQLLNKLQRIEEDMEELNNRQKLFLNSIKENIEEAFDSFNKINNNDNSSSSSSSSSSPPKILYTVLTKKMSSIHRRAKLIEE